MRSIRNIFALLLGAISAAGLCLSVSGCQPDGLVDNTEFSLYYSGITDIGPSTPMTLSPTYHGSQPSDFRITRITLDEGIFESDAFSINPNTGVFSMSGTDNLPVGFYEISISCVSGGKTYEFPSAITINMMKAVPDGIAVEPDYLKLPLTDITSPTGETELPTARITTDGDHISIKGYQIAGARRNGVTVTDAESMFEVSSEGVISIKGNNPDFLPGTYVLDFKLITYVVGEDSEEGIFSNALTVDVTSAPKSITYTPNTGKIEVGKGWEFDAPAVSGSLNGIVFSFSSVRKMTSDGSSSDLTEAELQYVAIDASTGAISVMDGHTFADGDEIAFSVKAENEYGDITVARAFVINVVTEIAEISGFRYNSVEVVQTQAISNSIDEGFSGDDVVFSFVSLDSKLSELSIDQSTGDISAPRGHEIPMGKYAVTVRAENQKGSVETTFVLSIAENPYYFTYITYGNNLGLTPAEEYPNQFRIDFDAVKTLDLPAPETDIKDGQPVSFSLSVGANAGVSFLEKTEQHTMNPDGSVNFDFTGAGRNIQVAKISATVGEGETSVTRETLVFIHLSQSLTNSSQPSYRVEYTPFVFRFNPRTGEGLDNSPVLKVNGADPASNFSIDFRGDQRYANLNGPSSHVSGRQSDEGSVVNTLWKWYYNATGLGLNTSSKDPVSFFTQTSYMNLKLLYVDNTDGYRIKVNPNIWTVDGAWCNGLYIGQMNQGEVPGGQGNPTTNFDKPRPFQCVVWFDEKF